MDSDSYAVVVPVGAPTVPPPRLPPILIPGSLVPVTLAQPWRRAVALVLDATPFLAAAFALALALQGSHIAHAFGNALLLKNTDVKTLGLPEPTLAQPLDGSDAWILLRFTAAMLAVFVAWTAYRTVMLARYGATVAKMLLGIAVVQACRPAPAPDAHAGAPPVSRTAGCRPRAHPLHRDHRLPVGLQGREAPGTARPGGKHPGSQAISLSAGRSAGTLVRATPSRSSDRPKVMALSMAAHRGSLLK